MLCSPTQIAACHRHLYLAQARPHDAVSICLVIVLVHKLHSLGIGKLPDPILRAWYYAIAEAENRVWPRETNNHLTESILWRDVRPLRGYSVRSSSEETQTSELRGLFHRQEALTQRKQGRFCCGRIRTNRVYLSLRASAEYSTRLRKSSKAPANPIRFEERHIHPLHEKPLQTVSSIQKRKQFRYLLQIVLLQTAIAEG